MWHPAGQRRWSCRRRPGRGVEVVRVRMVPGAGRGPVRAVHRDPLGVSAPGAGPRLGDDLLATAAGPGRGRGPAAPARAAAFRAAGRRPAGLLPRSGRCAPGDDSLGASERIRGKSGPHSLTSGISARRPHSPARRGRSRARPASEPPAGFATTTTRGSRRGRRGCHNRRRRRRGAPRVRASR